VSNKVTLIIYDKDLKARTVKRFPVSADGSKIDVKIGDSTFSPTFDNESFIDIRKRSLLMPWRKYWERFYFVPNYGSACVNFQTETVLEPDPKIVMQAAKAEIISNWGKTKQDTPMILTIILIVLILIAAKIFGVIA